MTNKTVPQASSPRGAAHAGRRAGGAGHCTARRGAARRWEEARLRPAGGRVCTQLGSCHSNLVLAETAFCVWEKAFVREASCGRSAIPQAAAEGT